MEIQMQFKVRKWCARKGEVSPYDIVMGANNGTYHSTRTFASVNEAKKAIEEFASGFPFTAMNFKWEKEGSVHVFDEIEEAK